MNHITVSEFYKKLFGTKVYKISLESGCSCPNRDGTKGTGGCIFCSEKGSGDFTSNSDFDIPGQIEQAKQIVDSKFPKKSNKKYIVYFQNFTNTYGNFNQLKEKWEQAINCSDIVGIAIATRPDCVTSEMLEYFDKLSDSIFVQIEFGLQTSNDETGNRINRCYDSVIYKEVVKQMKKMCPKVHVVTHIIFGLPGETEKHMMETVDYCLDAGTDGIKITVLYVLKNTVLEYMYKNGRFTTLEKDEYLALVKLALKKIPSSVVIHRLTGDPPKSLVVSPMWTCNKKKVLSEINNLLEIV